MAYSSEDLGNSGLPAEILSFVRKYEMGDDIIAFTSGSTGKPKKIRLKTAHMRASALKTLQYLGLQRGQSCLLCLSPKYIAGMMMLVRWMEGELDLYFAEPGSEPLREIKGSIDFTAMVPYQVFHSLDQLQKVKTLLVGGGVVDPGLEKNLRGTDCRVFQSYGMTETITHIALREVNPYFQQNYSLLQGIEVHLDERSCLVINAPDIGVENLVTNDVVQLVSETEFRWLGRYDNVVNSGGIKIYPEQLESQLEDLGVSYFFAGVPDQALGEKLVMIIESDNDTLRKDILPKLEALPKYHRPREIRLLRQFARTKSGKLIRNAILETAFPRS